VILQPFLDSVRRTRLDNGLTLLTREEKRGGVVAILTWVKAGYFHEPDEVAGMAHLFEHMFFKGSKRYPGAEEIAQHVSMLGGMTNAGTIYDSTSYYFVLPREGFVKGVEIQADAIRNPLFDPEELRKECEVVIEESNRKFDNPPALATERMFATAFTRHRMKRWRIGSNDVLRNINRDHLIEFFQTLYRPENIVVSVVGDVSHQEALDVVSRAFGPLPVGQLIKQGGEPEPVQNEFRFSEARGDIGQSISVMGWHTPGVGHPDEERLEVLSTILAGGKYSRLYRSVVGPTAASTVSASNSAFEDVGIFTVRASFDDANLERVEERIVQQLEQMKRKGPSLYELALARNKNESAFVFELEEVLGQAQTLAYFEARGGFEMIGDHLRRMETMTVDEVRDVAERYLTLDNLTVHHYRPNGVAESTREAERQRIEWAMRGGSSEPPVEFPLPEVGTPLAEPHGSRGIQRYVLSNGITLFVQEVADTPTVSASIAFRGGRIHEHSRNAGITQLLARSMRRGTKKRGHEEINREIEFLGSQLGAAVDEDFFGFSLDILRNYFAAGFEILSDVVLHPTFLADQVEEERHLQIASIRRSLDSSSERPFQLFEEAFYGNFPYALPSAGYISSVEAIDRDALVDWYQREVVADGAHIVIVGDVVAEEVQRLCEAHFGSLQKSVSRRPPLVPFVPPATRREIAEQRDRKQSAIVIGFPAVPPQHPDWMLLRILGSVASGLAGTFFAELRGKRSLAYTVYAGEAAHEQFGTFIGYIATDAAKETAAREGLLGELRRLAEDGFTDADVERAKSYIAGATKIRLQTNSALGGEIAQKYLYGLGLDFTARFLERVRVTRPEELREVAKRYLTSENYVIATVRGKA
jgi:zinc protease